MITAPESTRGRYFSTSVQPQKIWKEVPDIYVTHNLLSASLSLIPEKEQQNKEKQHITRHYIHIQLQMHVKSIL